MRKDVTELVDFLNPDDECLSIIQCVCGQKFESWDFIIDIYEETPSECPACGANLFFRNAIRVYQVVNDENN